MRWMRDVVAAIGLVAVVGGTLYIQREHREEESIFQTAQGDVRRMEMEIKYRAATKTTDLNARGWPVTVDPSWFKGSPPINSLLDDDRPWVEVAGTNQAELLHPPVRMAVDNQLAAFWYNPYQGVIRARVPVMVSDEKATDLYNRVNGVVMPSIFVRESVADRVKPVTPPAPATDDVTQPAPASQPEEKPVATFTIRRTDRKSGSRR
jgi:hypothetical protein